jgi:hypothetical protein
MFLLATTGEIHDASAFSSTLQVPVKMPSLREQINVGFTFCSLPWFGKEQSFLSAS